MPYLAIRSGSGSRASEALVALIGAAQPDLRNETLMGGFAAALADAPARAHRKRKARSNTAQRGKEV